MNKTTTSNFYNKSKQLPPVKTEKPDPSIIKLSDEKKYIALNRQDFNNSIIQKWGEIIISKLPVRRTNHISFIYDNYFYIFGGRDINETKMNDMYRVKLDFSEDSCEKWEKINYDGDITPECVAGHKAVLIGNLLYVFGGVNITEDANNTIYIFNVEKRKWSKKKFRENQIIPLSAHSMSLVGKLIVIVGGYSKGKFNEKTFLYDYQNNIWDSYPREMTPEEIEEENRRIEEEERRKKEEEEERKRKEEEERTKKEEEEKSKMEELERSRKEEEERKKKEKEEEEEKNKFKGEYFEYKDKPEHDPKTLNILEGEEGNNKGEDNDLPDLISDNIKKDIMPEDDDNKKDNVEQEIKDSKILHDKETEELKEEKPKKTEEPKEEKPKKTEEPKEEKKEKEEKPKKTEEEAKKSPKKQEEKNKEEKKKQEDKKKDQPKKKEETKQRKNYFCRKPKKPEPTPDEVPEPRINQSQVTISDTLLYIYGGINSEGHYLDDMWSFSISEYLWTKIEIKGETPVPRSGHSCLIQGNNLFIFGGKIANIFEVNEFWKFDLKTNRFTLIHDTLLEMGNNEGKGLYKPKEKNIEYHDPYHTFYKLKKMNMPNKTANDFYNNNKNNVHQNKYEDLVMKDYKAKIMKNSLIFRIEPEDQVFIKKLNQANQDIKLDKIRYGIVPVPRDGHSCFMYDDKMYVFGGDRNKFPFNDMFVYDFNREVKQKENVDESNVDKDSRNKPVNVTDDKKSQISSKSKTSKNTTNRKK